MDVPPKPYDDDAVRRLFLDNDDLGPDSSLFLRCTRMFLREGKPLGQLTVMAFPSGDAGSLPFGVVTETKKNRIVFWPVAPRDAEMMADHGRPSIFDHVTLELPSQEVHTTAYDRQGNSVHYAASDLGHSHLWRLCRVEGTGLALWFVFLVRWSLLREQDLAVQRLVSAPPSDVKRRMEELTQFSGKVAVADVPLRVSENAGDYVFCAAYFVEDTSWQLEYSPDLFPVGIIRNRVQEFSDTACIEVCLQKVSVGENLLVFVAGCPSGHFDKPIGFAFPGRGVGGGR
jgi:hypothetical protein